MAKIVLQGVLEVLPYRGEIPDPYWALVQWGVALERDCPYCLRAAGQKCVGKSSGYPKYETRAPHPQRMPDGAWVKVPKNNRPERQPREPRPPRPPKQRREAREPRLVGTVPTEIKPFTGRSHFVETFGELVWWDKALRRECPKCLMPVDQRCVNLAYLKSRSGIAYETRSPHPERLL